MSECRLDVCKRAGTAVRTIVIGTEVGRCHGYLIVSEWDCFVGDLGKVILWKRAREAIVGRRFLAKISLVLPFCC